MLLILIHLLIGSLLKSISLQAAFFTSRQPVKERRKTLRTIKKGYLDIENQKEQLGYEAGGF